MNEQTLILIKPDGVKRNLAGKIISRFEESGLKIKAIKMLQASEDLAKQHYFLDENWAKNVFNKTKASCEKEGRKMRFETHFELGKTIQKWNMEFLTEGPIIALIIEGPHAIELVRKMVGSTEPRSAQPGTIRGDLASTESYSLADSQNRVLRNLIHASDSQTTAQREISLWFKKEEIH